MIDSLSNPQLSRLKDCHHRLFKLLDSTRLRTLEYLPFPSPVRPQERQQELSLFADLTTLHSLATEFFSLLKTSRPHGSIDVLKKHSADLALPSDLETYENWLNELDSRGVEIWNHASQVKRVLETKSTGGSLRDYRKQSYDISLNLLREQSTHVKRKTGFSEFRPSDITPSEKVYSGLRQLAFILIHAGTPTEIDTTGALRMIKIASKSAKAQLAICNLELAIKNVDIASESWASGNETGTIFNLRKALELFKSNHRIFELKDKIYIVSRLYTFAYVILRLYDESNNDDRLHNETKTNAKLLKAYEWLSLGLDVLENNELEKDSYGTLPLGDKPSWWNLKLKILKALAYAYSEAGSLELNKDHAKSLRMKGDRALDEALAMNPDQTICLVKIQSVSRKSSSDSDLKSAFSSALRTNPFDSELIGKLMSVAHKVEGESIRVELFAKIFLECLTKETDEQRHLGDSAFYALVLNSVASQRQFLKHSLDKSKETPILNRDSDNSKKLKYLREVSDAGTISNSEFRLASDCAFMTQTVIWHFADQEYRAMSFRTAAEWYEFGTHPLFLETGNLTFAKLTRKASLSWLNHGNYEFAGRCLKSLPSICFKESGTHFLSFMIEAAQGNEENAARAIDRIMACLDFKTESLLYAARQADHRGLKGLLHHILEKILDATVGGSTELSHSLTNAISRLKKLCNESEELSLDGPSAEKLTKIKCCIWVWEFETYCLGRDWSSVEDFIQNVVKLIQTQSGINVSLCSRWLRILIDLKVSNGDDQGGLKHAETAIQLQRNYPTYPSDEANWILARSWDRSIDLYSSKNIELSKKWCEVSLNWMKIVVGGRSYEDMMNRHYQDLLKLTTTSDEPAHLLLE
ncbi:expressed protein [Phakopsora pachyrhizi]|uniref:Expressed protein n=1 Tax=Phakopsora pachyrhizi TaxID=170000 RepID=A0AAV0BHE5_PHAPC|nr:expressed protein [Phakopsora pachyrhizi]